MAEDKVGIVIKYFAKPEVAAVEVTSGEIRVGDRLHFVGHTTDFEMEISSMQEENQNIEEARPGQQIGVKVPDRVRSGDQVFKVS